jgi:hypothetical protein
MKYTGRTKLFLLSFFIFNSTTFCIEPPYLISATALSDSTVKIVWRNNDIASQGFIINRCDSTDKKYHCVDTVRIPTQASFTDTQNIYPLTTYTYYIQAFENDDISDSSNHILLKTQAALLQKGNINADWNYDTSNAVKISIKDNSKSETGYRVYRSTNDTSHFTLLTTINSKNPYNKDSIIWYDSKVSPNCWYIYRAVAFTATDTLCTDPCTTYTLRNQHPKNIVKFSKVSEFPITLGGLSAKAGDSIIMKESNAPEGKYSIIDIKDPVKPKFVGYADSSVLIDYQKTTLIPFYLKFGVYNSSNSQNIIYNKEILFVSKPGYVNLYNANDFTLIDSIGIGIDRIIKINDSLYFIQKPTISSIGAYNRSASILKISNDKTSEQLLNFNENGRNGMGAHSSTEYNVIGQIDNNLILSVDYNYSGTMQSRDHHIEVYNPDLNLYTKNLHSSTFSYTENSGYYILPSIYISILNYGSINIEFFASNVLDCNSYETALTNQSIYTDTTTTSGQAKNLLLDTLNKRIYVITNSKLSVISYEFSPAVAIKSKCKSMKNDDLVKFSVQKSSVITVAFTKRNQNLTAVLRIFDLSGRMVDRIETFSNSIQWKPKHNVSKFYLADLVIGKNHYMEKFCVQE